MPGASPPPRALLRSLTFVERVNNVNEIRSFRATRTPNSTPNWMNGPKALGRSFLRMPWAAGVTSPIRRTRSLAVPPPANLCQFCQSLPQNSRKRAKILARFPLLNDSLVHAASLSRLRLLLPRDPAQPVQVSSLQLKTALRLLQQTLHFLEGIGLSYRSRSVVP